MAKLSIQIIKNSKEFLRSILWKSEPIRNLLYRLKLDIDRVTELKNVFIVFNDKRQIKFEHNIIGEPVVSGSSPVRILLKHKSMLYMDEGAFVRGGVCIELSGRSRLLVGKGSYINWDSNISAGGSAIIKIGIKCAIGCNVNIYAYDYHRVVNDDGTEQDYFDDITIGDHVWIGAGALILKGANIGSGSIIGAGSVVLKGEYPPLSLIAGNPGKVVKNGVSWRNLTVEEKRFE